MDYKELKGDKSRVGKLGETAVILKLTDGVGCFQS